MSYARMLVFGAGILLFSLGHVFFAANRDVLIDSVDINLFAVEKGAKVKNNHWNIGPHHALYERAVYESRKLVDPRDFSAPIEYCYYPIVSIPSELPFQQEMAELQQKYPWVEEVLDEKVYYKPKKGRSCLVIIKTRRYESLGDIPRGNRRCSARGNLTIKSASVLSSKVLDRLREKTAVDKYQLIVAEEGREWELEDSFMYLQFSWPMWILGILLCLLSIVGHRLPTPSKSIDEKTSSL